MPFPIALALQGAGMLSSFFGGRADARAQRRQTQAANAILARILPVQTSEFNNRYNLTNQLNQLLMDTEANRYNDVGSREITTRGQLGDESIRRFDEQAAAVDDQVATNRTSVRQLLDEVQAATEGGISAFRGERDRQRGYQGTADTIAAALAPQLGAAPDAARRAAAVTGRVNLADTAIGAADTGGYAPETHSRVMSEFARRGTDARATAMDDAAKTADVGSYEDSRAEADRTIAQFGDVMSRLRTQAATSRAALPSELAVFDRRGQGAVSAFNGRDALSSLIASGTRDIADRYRTGRMAAIEDAGAGDVASASNLFQRLMGTAQESFGGRINASERYENLFSNLMNQTAARVMGSTPSPSPLTGIGALLQGAGSLIPPRTPRG